MPEQRAFADTMEPQTSDVRGWPLEEITASPRHLFPDRDRGEVSIDIGSGDFPRAGHLAVDLHTDAGVRGNCLHLPFLDHSVDRVWCSHVLEHFDHEVGHQLLVEIRRVLSPSGSAAFIVPDAEKLVSKWLNAPRLRNSHISNAILGQKGLGQSHRALFWADGFQQAVTRAGMKTSNVLQFWSHGMPCLALKAQRADGPKHPESWRLRNKIAMMALGFLSVLPRTIGSRIPFG